MARIEDIERRLLNWARWKFSGTAGGLGYAAVRCWGQPSNPGRREAVIPTIDCEAEEIDRAISSLEPRLRATVEVVYLQGCSLRRKAAQLCCSEATVTERIARAHLKLSQWFAERASIRRDERQRVAHLCH